MTVLLERGHVGGVAEAAPSSAVGPPDVRLDWFGKGTRYACGVTLAGVRALGAKVLVDTRDGSPEWVARVRAAEAVCVVRYDPRP